MKLEQKIKLSVNLIRCTAKIEPKLLFVELLQILLQSVTTLVTVYFPKIVIDCLQRELPYQVIVKKVIVFCTFLLILHVIHGYLKERCAYYTQIFEKEFKKNVGQLCMEVDFELVEGAGNQNIIQLAGRANSISNAVGVLQAIISDIATMIPLICIVVGQNIYFLCIIFAVLLVKVGFLKMNTDYYVKRRLLYANNGRIECYVGNTMYKEGSSKEIRLNRVQDWYSEKIKGFRSEMLRLQFEDFNRGRRHGMIMSGITAIQSLLMLLLLAQLYVDGTITIAQFTMLFGAATAITGYLTNLTDEMISYNNKMVDLSDYEKLQMRSGKTNPGVPKMTEMASTSEQDERSGIEIEFINVSFRYDNTTKDVLKQINIKIREKEKLVIVGHNGAGKTTFIKLLCKFYRPTEGKITLNGEDIWKIPNETYYRQVSAVFQDFKNFAFSLSENITLQQGLFNQEVERAVYEAGLESCVHRMQKGFATSLSKNFDDEGIELSGGQNQKVAIARALYKNSPIIILDEPTASLDPKAEREIYESFFNVIKDKTAIFISHRLAVSTIADHIAVFDQGRIVEYGVHNKLMEEDRGYADMFRKQSKQYISAEGIF